MLDFWRILWTTIWFGGLTLFTVLSVIITIQGGRDLLAMLRGLEDEKREANSR